MSDQYFTPPTEEEIKREVEFLDQMTMKIGLQAIRIAGEQQILKNMIEHRHNRIGGYCYGYLPERFRK